MTPETAALKDDAQKRRGHVTSSLPMVNMLRVCACRNAGGDYAFCSEPAHVALRIECVHASAGVMLSGGRRGTCCEGSACTICSGPKTRHAYAVGFAKKRP